MTIEKKAEHALRTLRARLRGHLDKADIEKVIQFRYLIKIALIEYDQEIDKIAEEALAKKV